eukprot:CCRYP_015361-RA/>CCRYP_015361-RA protein AED:0.00 eAED:0.00 QI:17/1/1/1/0/0/2/77/53
MWKSIGYIVLCRYQQVLCKQIMRSPSQMQCSHFNRLHEQNRNKCNFVLTELLY